MHSFGTEIDAQACNVFYGENSSQTSNFKKFQKTNKFCRNKIILSPVDGTFDKAPRVGKQKFYQVILVPPVFLHTLNHPPPTPPPPDVDYWGVFLGKYFCFLRVCLQKKTRAAYETVYEFIWLNLFSFHIETL